MHPCMAAELGTRFKLATALRQGMLPVVWDTDDPVSVLEAYNALYLREQVQVEGLVRNIGAFPRFLEAKSFSHASVLNLTVIGRSRPRFKQPPANTSATRFPTSRYVD